MCKYLVTFVELVLFFMFIWSCSDRTFDIEYVNISLNSSDTVISSFNDYFEVTECLPLEGPVESQVSFARRIEFFEDEYYVFSSNGNVGLFVFDKNGKFVRQIGNKGNGRGEYSNILDFSIDKKNRRILMICNRCSLVKIFTLDGEYIEDKVLHETSLSDIACINGLIVCPTNHQGFTRNESDSLFYIFDEKFNFLNKHTFVSDNRIGTTSFIPSSIKSYGDKFIYSDFHEHRTFLLNGKGEIVRCFKYEEEDLISLENQKSIKRFMDNQVKSSFILSSSLFNDNCVTFYKAGKEVRISINKYDGERVVNTSIGSFPYFLGYDGDKAISAVPFEELKALNVENKSNYTTNKNYYIIKYKLRSKYEK